MGRRRELPAHFLASMPKPGILGQPEVEGFHSLAGPHISGPRRPIPHRLFLEFTELFHEYLRENTILIAGGGSEIGRGLAEALHASGNHVIVAGRRRSALDAVTTANPGIRSLAFDVADEASIRSFAAEVTAKYPKLNVLINNAGIMRAERLADAPAGLADAEAIIATNLLGPIRLTLALLPHLKQQNENRHQRVIGPGLRSCRGPVRFKAITYEKPWV